MTFHMDIVKECLATWVHVKLLETLMECTREVSQRQLARLIGIPRATIQRALNDLGQTGLIKPRRVGSSIYWEIDKKNYLYETLRPILEGLKILIPPLPYLKDLIKKTLSLPKGCRCFVFGSVSRGEDGPQSDIDVALILPDNLKIPSPTLTKNLEILQDLCRERFGKRLSTFFVSERGFKKQDKELYKNIAKGIETTS